jgi:hypothetical protein
VRTSSAHISQPLCCSCSVMVGLSGKVALPSSDRRARSLRSYVPRSARAGMPLTSRAEKFQEFLIELSVFLSHGGRYWRL